MSCPFLSSAQQEKTAIGEAHAKVTYPGQLQLASLLNSQNLLTYQPGNTPVHDEHLFIVTHQAFELWFKQIIFELNSIREIFDKKLVEDSALPVACERLDRITKIFNVLIAQFEVISTMAPQEFGELRPSLGDSSGYQSCQYRLLEVKLGVRDDLRIKYADQSYQDSFEGTELESLKTSQKESSLFDAIDQWLARTPGLEVDGFNFIGKFKDALERMIEDGEDKKTEELNTGYTTQETPSPLRERFDSVFNETKHKELVHKGSRRFSYKAFQGALMIFHYRHEPQFHYPHLLLTSLIDIDQKMAQWRHYHANMVQKMIGNLAGTGGSSGYMYLRSLCSDRYKVFLDLANLSSYYIPMKYMPQLQT
nr:tryptophan 2,3-dioxygenase isoform X1 [Ciona intestinalis]|eukprot:XP_002128288.1 tryptophan 2,3-dioxygenase isoform X1 [Ciona intestinalis]